MKLLLLGDVCSTPVNRALFEAEDVPALFTDTLSLFEGNDAVMVNLECAITDSDHAIPKFGPNLKSPLSTARVLKKVGVTHCGLSNNHIFDFGIPGVTETMRELDAVGIAYTGFGKNLADSRKNMILEQNGERIAVVAVCEHEYSYALENRMGSRPFDEIETLEDIRAAKAEADRVIVMYHGGKEYCQYPSPRLVKVCRGMARAGADVILCQHTHCIGCYEEYQGCHILYGQGNFHFLLEKVPEIWNSLLAVHYDTKAHTVEFTPIVNQAPAITLAKGAEKEALLSAFAARNQQLKNGEWKQGWHEFCLSYKEKYRSALQNVEKEDSTERQNALFGHYLDCEAHTDVWRELYPTYNQTNEL